MLNTSIVYAFLLVLVRITAFMVTAPVFSSKGIPNHFKLGLSFFVALVIYPTLYIGNQEILFNSNYIILLLVETMIGLSLGWLAQLIFSAIQIAGAFIDMQIGFAIANVIDPQTGAQSPLMGNFKYTFATLLFLTINGHHLFLDGLINSYQLISFELDWLSKLDDASTLVFVMNTFSKMFLIAFKIAAPIVGSLFIADVALGIVARTVPQLNVFVIGLPLKILLHFSILLMITPALFYMFKEVFYEIFVTMRQFMELMGN